MPESPLHRLTGFGKGTIEPTPTIAGLVAANFAGGCHGVKLLPRLALGVSSEG
jgi:hypothetical protein